MKANNFSMTVRKLTPWMLLLPALALLIAIFTVSIVKFLNYSLYGFSQGTIVYSRSIDNYISFFTDAYTRSVLFYTIRLAAETALITLLIGYPVSYACSRLTNQVFRKVMMVVVFLPLVTSVVVRSYGWFIILSTKGVINWLLQALNITSEPLSLVYNKGAVLVGNVHVLLPFMVFPILSSLSNMDPAVKEAAFDLGANKLRRFCYVTLPLSLPGVLSGIQVVFTLAISSYVTPVLLGGGKVSVLSRMIYDKTVGMDWPGAATAGAVMLVLAFLIMALFNRLEYFVRTE